MSEDNDYQQYIADCAGVINYDHFLEFKSNAVAGMKKYGDAFVRALGQALDRAEDKDAVKLMHIWRSEVSEHELLYKIYMAKEENRVLDNVNEDDEILSNL